MARTRNGEQEWQADQSWTFLPKPLQRKKFQALFFYLVVDADSTGPERLTIPGICRKLLHHVKPSCRIRVCLINGCVKIHPRDTHWIISLAVNMPTKYWHLTSDGPLGTLAQPACLLVCLAALSLFLILPLRNTLRSTYAFLIRFKTSMNLMWGAKGLLVRAHIIAS